MNRAVWRYELSLNSMARKDKAIWTFQMPKGAEILSAHMKGGNPNIWVEVNPSERVLRDRNIQVIGTGHSELDPNRPRVFIGTCVDELTGFVWHVYEEIEDDGDR